jgi:peptidoglycan/LPS O-acetylase OafA/YrhL
VLHALTYTTNFHQGRWYLQHTWTLSIEEQFYLLWPAIMLWAGRSRAATIACVIVLAGPLVRLSVMTDAFSNSVDLLSLTFRGVSDTLAAGCALALLRPRLHSRTRYLQLLETRWMALAPLVSIACWTAFGHPRIAAVTRLASVVLFTLFIDRQLTFRTASARVLNAAPVAWVGRMSYSLYLWQMLFISPPGLLDPWQQLPFAHGILRFGGILVATLLSYYGVERPFLRLRDMLERALGERGNREQEAALTARVAAEAVMPEPR